MRDAADIRDGHGDDLLLRLAALAAHVAGVSTAIIALDGVRTVHGDPTLQSGTPGFALHRAIQPGGGTLSLLDAQPHPPPGPGQEAGIEAIVAVILTTQDRAHRHAELQEFTGRAVRADKILRLVSEAATCADALTSLLEELCRHHDALVGRIWRLGPDGLMHEVSRFNGHALDANSYYHAPASAPVRAGNSRTAEAIARNEPDAFVYSKVVFPDRWVLLRNAMAAGLASQISFPFWVQDERFGIALAFTTERPDLDAIVADIASLANTIRPALFRKVTEERIRHLAHHDELTQLSNRTAFNDALHYAVQAAATEPDGALTLLYLDLDGFKRVNDTRGHEVGDNLLAEVAVRLRAEVRESDVVARIGGDEFAIVQPWDGDGAALAQRLLARFREPFLIDGQRSLVGISIGIARYPADGTSPGQLLRNADVALYEAKQSGRNTYRVYDPLLGAQRRARTAVEQDLKDAIEARSFQLAYQPICDGRTLQVRGMEALLRWTHPVRGVQSPGMFVPIAEASGLILPLGRWALEAACAEAAGWPEAVHLSVNFSPLQFRQPGLPQVIASVLHATGLAARRLDLEVTEGLLLDDSEGVLRTMAELKALGVRITLDDFGTAYASLSSLRRFPFDRIKIDRSFIQDICNDSGTLAIVQAVLSLSERLSVEVVAEGVETEDELMMLQRLGCRLVQGFLTGRPMSGPDARALLTRGPNVALAAK